MNNLLISTKILSKMENSSTVGMFVKDTGGCLISRVALSRSKDESREIAFAEIFESVIFYFSAPAVVKLAQKKFSKLFNITPESLSKPLNELKNIDSETLKRIKLGKFGKIGTTFSLILPLVFGIAPLRNLLTLSKTGKEEFVSVVELKREHRNRHGYKHRNKPKSKAVQKTHDFIKKMISASILGLTATAGLLLMTKNKRIYKNLEPTLDKFIKHLDFTRDCDLKTRHFGWLIYPASIAGYFHASRDKYEKLENARRFSITVPLLFFGEKLIQKPIYKCFDKLFNTGILKTMPDKSTEIMSFNDILKSIPLNQRKNYLKSKSFAYGITFFVNTMAIAAAVALLNRIATKNLYEKNEKFNCQKSSQNIPNMDSWLTKHNNHINTSINGFQSLLNRVR